MKQFFLELGKDGMSCAILIKIEAFSIVSRDLDRKLQNALCKLLEERGINDELSGFLHEYMLNKDRTEFVRWLEKLKSSIEK